MITELTFDRNKVALTIKELLTSNGELYFNWVIYLPANRDHTIEENQFIDSVNHYSENLCQLILDMQEVNKCYERMYNDPHCSFEEYILSNNSKISDSFKDFIIKRKSQEADLSKFITNYVFMYKNLCKDLQTAMINYFKYEEARINAILTKDL